MSNQIQNFDPVTFFKEYEAIIEGFRNNSQTTIENLEARKVEARISTENIYTNHLEKRIKAACEYLSRNKVSSSINNNDSEKTQILNQYFLPNPRPQIHVIQGPPGTGKTELSAIYILLYLLEWHVTNGETSQPKPIIAVSAFTHKAIENVLLRIERLFPLFYALALHKGLIPKPSNDKCQAKVIEGVKKACDTCFYSFARMIKLHAQSKRSDFKGDEDDRFGEFSEFANDLVFGNRTDVPTDDATHPLGIHDMRVNWQNLEWFLSSDQNAPNKSESCPDHTCSFTKKEQFKLSNCGVESCLLKRIQSFDRPTIIGCTTSQLIKLRKLNNDVVEKFEADFLLLDEASMMMLPDFLPLADRVKKQGHMVVVGDDLQLGPISQNDWSKEIRPSLIEEKPWNSVFHYLRRKAHPKPQEKGSVTFKCYKDAAQTGENTNIAWAALQTTYRLTAEATRLIQPAYDRVEVTLRPKDNTSSGNTTNAGFQRIICQDCESNCSINQPLFQFVQINGKVELSKSDSKVTLITYEGRDTGTESSHERCIIKNLLQQGLLPNNPPNSKKKDLDQSIAIVTPYHDQIEKLKSEIGPLFEDEKIPGWLLIDTVNKLQGDERDVIIFSACVSGTENLLTHGSFVMELQRTNVAFSRAKKKLIVIASESLLNYIPSGFEEYQASLLWKNLRDLCHLGTLKSEILELSGQLSDMIRCHKSSHEDAQKEAHKLKELIEQVLDKCKNRTIHYITDYNLKIIASEINSEVVKLKEEMCLINKAEVRHSLSGNDLIKNEKQKNEIQQDISANKELNPSNSKSMTLINEEKYYSIEFTSCEAVINKAIAELDKESPLKNKLEALTKTSVLLNKQEWKNLCDKIETFLTQDLAKQLLNGIAHKETINQEFITLRVTFDKLKLSLEKCLENLNNLPEKRSIAVWKAKNNWSQLIKNCSVEVPDNHWLKHIIADLQNGISLAQSSVGDNCPCKALIVRNNHGDPQMVKEIWENLSDSDREAGKPFVTLFDRSKEFRQNICPTRLQPFHFDFVAFFITER